MACGVPPGTPSMTGVACTGTRRTGGSPRSTEALFLVLFFFALAFDRLLERSRVRFRVLDFDSRPDARCFVGCATTLDPSGSSDAAFTLR